MEGSCNTMVKKGVYHGMNQSSEHSYGANLAPSVPQTYLQQDYLMRHVDLHLKYTSIMVDVLCVCI